MQDISHKKDAPEAQPENRYTETAQYDTGDDFWNLYAPAKSAYRPPSLHGHSMDTTLLTDSMDEEMPRIEKIPPRTDTANRTDATNRFTRSADAYTVRSAAEHPVKRTEREIPEPFPQDDIFEADMVAARKRAAGETISDRDTDGWLLRHITVRNWMNDYVYYGRFGRDALRSHRQHGNPDALNNYAPYSSYLPQYWQMSRAQLQFYLAFRDSVRTDAPVDLPASGVAYVLLYAYEIINLPEWIPPTQGMKLLCHLWEKYRTLDRRLDSLFGEWVPDYAMIHNVPLDPCILPCLPEIVRKANFKEFYLDALMAVQEEDSIALLADVFAQSFSDYDYRTSRYYHMHSAAYDETIRTVLQRTVEDAYRTGREPFCLKQEYRIERDAYVGAIAQTNVKMRLSITFTSCLRTEKTRNWVTGIIKYTENRLRKRLGLRAALHVDHLEAADQAIIDACFRLSEREVPHGAPDRKKTDTAQEEEQYMRFYEADSRGFDSSAAGQIEAASWENAVRLTCSTTMPDAETESAESEKEPDGFSETIPAESGNCAASSVPTAADTPETACTNNGDLLRAALHAALHGEFTAFCRNAGEFPGQIAERINEKFIEEMGDVVLIGEGTDYAVLEDYRMEAEAWSKS